MQGVSACACGFLLRCGYDVVWEGEGIIQPPKVPPNCLDPLKDPVLPPLQAIAMGQTQKTCGHTMDSQGESTAMLHQWRNGTLHKYKILLGCDWKFERKLKIEENTKHLPWTAHIENGPCKAKHHSWKTWDQGRFTPCTRDFLCFLCFLSELVSGAHLAASWSIQDR